MFINKSAGLFYLLIVISLAMNFFYFDMISGSVYNLVLSVLSFFLSFVVRYDARCFIFFTLRGSGYIVKIVLSFKKPVISKKIKGFCFLLSKMYTK